MSLEFTLQDSKGNSHSYVVNYYNVSDALKIGEEVLPVIGSFFDGKVDVSRLGSGGIELDIKSAMNELSRKLRMDIICDILKNTRRDNRILNEGEINIAYAGNLGEMLEACMQVLILNFGDSIERVTMGKIQQVGGS